jgi:hypothetical protein
VAEVISLTDVAAARRRARQQRHLTSCIEILEGSLRETLHLFATAPMADRPVRARQVRQLAELLEYVVREV